MSASWLEENIASAKSSGKLISLHAQEYAFRLNWHVSILLSILYSWKVEYNVLNVAIFLCIVLMHSIANIMHHGRVIVILEWKK